MVLGTPDAHCMVIARRSKHEGIFRIPSDAVNHPGMSLQDLHQRTVIAVPNKYAGILTAAHHKALVRTSKTGMNHEPALLMTIVLAYQPPLL